MSLERQGIEPTPRIAEGLNYADFSAIRKLRSVATAPFRAVSDFIGEMSAALGNTADINTETPIEPSVSPFDAEKIRNKELLHGLDVAYENRRQASGAVSRFVTQRALNVQTKRLLKSEQRLESLKYRQ